MILSVRMKVIYSSDPPGWVWRCVSVQSVEYKAALVNKLLDEEHHCKYGSYDGRQMSSRKTQWRYFTAWEIWQWSDYLRLKVQELVLISCHFLSQCADITPHKTKANCKENAREASLSAPKSKKKCTHITSRNKSANPVNYPPLNSKRQVLHHL